MIHCTQNKKHSRKYSSVIRLAKSYHRLHCTRSVSMAVYSGLGTCCGVAAGEQTLNTTVKQWCAISFPCQHRRVHVLTSANTCSCWVHKLAQLIQSVAEIMSRITLCNNASQGWWEPQAIMFSIMLPSALLYLLDKNTKLWLLMTPYL